MTRHRITMQIDTRRWLHNAAEFYQSRGHHDEISQHIARTEEGPKGFKTIGDPPALGHDIGEDFLVVLTPCPGILEGADLACRLVAVFLFEQDVVVLVAFERGVEVDQVDGFVRDIPPEDVQVVAVVEGVFHDLIYCLFLFMNF